MADSLPIEATMSEESTQANVLIVGYSEAIGFEDIVHRIKNQFLINLEIEGKRGTSLINVQPLIKGKMSELTDIVIITGLTCMSWKKVPFKDDDPNSPYLITFDETYNNHDVVSCMEDLVGECIQKNSDVKVYLLIPTVKDIFKFNRKLLTKQKANSFLEEV